MWVAGLDVAFAELGAEALQEPDLLVGERDAAFGDGLLQAQQALMAGHQVVAAPDAAHAAGRHLEALENQLLGHPERPVGGVIERVGEDRLLDLLRHPVGVRPPGARQPVDQPLGAVGLVVAPDLVELLPGVAHEAAGPGHVVEVLGQL